MWPGLCVAVTPIGGTLKDWVTGTPPTVQSSPNYGKDWRGGLVMTAPGNALARCDFPDNPNHRIPSTAISLFVRFKYNGVSSVGNVAYMTKVQSSSASPFNSYSVQIGTANSGFVRANVGTTASNSITMATSAGTNVWNNAWVRWQSGSGITLDVIRDDGVIPVAQLVGTAVTGTIAYGALPLRVFGSEVDADFGPGGDFSLGMVWNRRFSDQEMYAATFDPFGWLRRP
jgi:hypothetical protein